MNAAALEALLGRDDVARLMALLNGDGEETRIIGGAVRNALLGMPTADVDLATTLLPEATSRLARKAGLKVVPTGIEHGTVTVIVDKVPFEVTTLREDVETDGRRARVRFGTSFERDALRRDFTINALSLDAAGRLHDYADGLADIPDRLVRFIGEPATRIREDYLRILRFYRFHAQYGRGSLDRAGYLATIDGREGLAGLSRERIRQETFKLLVAEGAAPAVVAMAEAGLLGAVFGGVGRIRRFSDLVARWPDADAVLRVAALALDIREDAGRLRDGLRLTRAEDQRLLQLAGLVEAHHDMPMIDAAQARRLIYRAGAAAFGDLAALRRAEGRDDAGAALAGRWQAPAPPFSGRDVGALGIAPGPLVGRVIAQAEDDWMAAGFPEEPARRRAILQQAVAMLGRATE